MPLARGPAGHVHLALKRPSQTTAFSEVDELEVVDGRNPALGTRPVPGVELEDLHVEERPVGQVRRAIDGDGSTT